nr:hypothetical protein [Gammaproteobacteria bacterium]
MATGIGVIGAVGVHAAILDSWGLCGPEKQNPRSGCRPGVWRNCLVGDPACSRAPVGYQARLWLNQYP